MTTSEFSIQLSNLNGIFYNRALRLTGNRQNASDLMQDTMIRAFVNRSKFIEGTNFKAWVNTIMRNCFINEYYQRRNRYSIEYLLEDHMTAATNHPVVNQGPTIIIMKELRNMLAELKDINRIPFEMLIEGFGYLEIAEQLDVPLGTVKSRIFFARKKLRAEITRHYGERVLYA